MSQQNFEDQPSNIHIKRPFPTRTFKELDRQQMEMNRRLKRKQKRASPYKIEQLASKYHIGNNSEDKISTKLQEITRNGNRIIAEWKNDQIHGTAEIFYQNGIYFKGLYQNGIKVKGHFKFKSGFEYIGNCFGNKFSEQGTLKFPNGKTIQGQWKDFQIIGNGKITYPKGEVYYGQIKQFKKHGKGYFYFRDGSKYEGEFRDGLITGKGSYYVQGKLISAGKWFNGQLQESQSLDSQQLRFQSVADKIVASGEADDQDFKELTQKKNVVRPLNQKSKNSPEDNKSLKKVQFK